MPPSRKAEPIVKYRGINKYFGDHHVLKDIDFDLYPGERVAIIGPSGSGKTTMARVLMTLEKPDSGTIEVGWPPSVAQGSGRKTRSRR